MKIQSINDIQVGTELVDNEGQIHHVMAINTASIEEVIQLQHYPNTKWYLAEVKCDKCGGISYLKFTSTSSEKLVCAHSIQKEGNTYSCGSKKYTEISRKSTGIKCTGYVLWGDLIKLYQLK